MAADRAQREIGKTSYEKILKPRERVVCPRANKERSLSRPTFGVRYAREPFRTAGSVFNGEHAYSQYAHAVQHIVDVALTELEVHASASVDPWRFQVETRCGKTLRRAAVKSDWRFIEPKLCLKCEKARAE